MRKILCSLFVVLTLACTGTNVHATLYNKIVVFGDSWSDNGYESDGYGRFPGPISDGPAWPDYLADPNHLNTDLLDAAYAGNTVQDVYDTVQLYLNYEDPSCEMLYAGFGGGIDIRHGWENGVDPDVTISNTVDTISTAISDLALAGGQDFLVMGLSKHTLLPGWNDNLDAFDYFPTVTPKFNDALQEAMASIEEEFLTDHNKKLNLYYLDVDAILESIIADPEGYGFTNVTDSGERNPPEGYLFYDHGHPSTALHKILADNAQQAVAPVPEPSTMVLLGSGLVGFVGARIRKRCKK